MIKTCLLVLLALVLSPSEVVIQVLFFYSIFTELKLYTESIQLQGIDAMKHWAAVSEQWPPATFTGHDNSHPPNDARRQERVTQPTSGKGTGSSEMVYSMWKRIMRVAETCSGRIREQHSGKVTSTRTDYTIKVTCKTMMRMLKYAVSTSAHCHNNLGSVQLASA